MQAQKLAEKLYAQARKRLGLPSLEVAEVRARFAHRQVALWDRAFALADRNGRIAVTLTVLLALSLALNIVQQGRPANVIFVDQLGQAKYFNELASPEPPRDYEAEHFARGWVRDFLSRDATTAGKDIARALTLAEPALQKLLKTQIVDSGDLDKARDANVHSSVDIESAKMSRGADDRREVLVQGHRILSAVGSDRKMPAEPFAVTLILSVVERSELTPNGLMVKYVSGSFGDHHPIGTSN